MLMMLPFEAPTIFEGIHKSYFRMPRVVKDQKSKFENDELFRTLSHESAVKYTGFKDRPLEERQMKFLANCQEGHTEISILQSGNQFTLMFNPTTNPALSHEGCDFDKELGKVHIKAGFILNGVCVAWSGWIDVQRLEGFGRLEFDEYRSYVEDTIVRDQIEKQQACNSVLSSSTAAAAAAAAAAASAVATETSPLRLGHHAHAHSHLATTGSPSGGPLGAAPGAVGLGPPGAAQLGLGSTFAGAFGHPLGQAPMPSQMGVASGIGPQAGQVLPSGAADSHYGNAAIAAAAAAAFHQALSGATGSCGPTAALQGLAGGASAAAAAAAAAVAGHGGPLPVGSLGGPPPPPPPSHLAYGGGPPNGLPLGLLPPPPSSIGSPPTNLNALQNTNGASNNRLSPEHRTHNHHNHQHQNNNQNHNHNNNSSNNNHHHHQHHRLSQSLKRSPEDPSQTQIDDVDVVSDISAHELDFPPRRIFKSSQISATSHHRTARRAA